MEHDAATRAELPIGPDMGTLRPRPPDPSDIGAQTDAPRQTADCRRRFGAAPLQPPHLAGHLTSGNRKAASRTRRARRGRRTVQRHSCHRRLPSRHRRRCRQRLRPRRISAADARRRPGAAASNGTVPGLIPAGNVTLLAGDGGTGKSLLAQQLADATVMGGTWLGQPVGPRRRRIHFGRRQPSTAFTAATRT